MNKLLLTVIVLALVASSGFSVVMAKPSIQPPDIVRGAFVDYAFNSPPWYPTIDSDNYKWAPRIYWASSDLPIDIIIYTKEEPSSLDTFSAISLGFDEWDDNTTATQLYDSITEDASSDWPGVSLDGSNTVGWDEIDGSGGVIGITYYWYNRATKQMVEFDIVLDEQESWSTDGTAGTFDVQSIATHEAGHTLVLGDIYSPRDAALTMYGYALKGNIDKRDLATGDISGVQAIYGP